jgi:hypothetical protein
MGAGQIRWRSVGRAGAIAVAVIGGLIALPSLLGGGDPPPVPPDVGLAPPSPAALPPAPAQHRLAKGGEPHSQRHPPRRHSRPARSRPDGRHRGRDRPQPRPTAPQATSTAYSPPVYSYPPPPSPGEFHFER